MSNGILLRRRDGSPILDWQDWEAPKEEYQWKAGRSALELARAWFTSPAPIVPRELRDLLASHSLTEDVIIEEGYPELVTPLPERGEGRNHDLVLKGKSGDIRTTICVEAKVDEPFGDHTVEDYWTIARRNREGANPCPTRAPERIESLLRLVFGISASPGRQPWAELRYQLLTAIAGTILQAIQDESVFAILVVHEFHTLDINKERVERNRADFVHAVQTVIGFSNLDVEAGRLYGPIRIELTPVGKQDLEFFIGKCIGKWRYPQRI